MHVPGHHRRPEKTVGRHEAEQVAPDGGLDGKSPLQVIRHQFRKRFWIDHRPAQGMGPDFRPLFDKGDLDGAVLLFGHLHKADGGRKAGRSAAYNQHVKFDLFSLVFHALDLLTRSK